MKLRVLMSECIEFKAVRYNGQMIHSPFVRALKPHIEFLPVCPEVAIGIGVPRDTLRIVHKDGVDHLIQPRTYRDVAEEMNVFTETYLQLHDQYRQKKCVYYEIEVNNSQCSGKGFAEGKVFT